MRTPCTLGTQIARIDFVNEKPFSWPTRELIKSQSDQSRAMLINIYFLYNDFIKCVL